jgi:hypothetical protein
MFENIHIFSDKKNIYKPTVFSQNLVEHLEQFFGTAHLAPMEITRRIDEPIRSTPALAPSQDKYRSTQTEYKRPWSLSKQNPKALSSRTITKCA